MKLTGYHAKYLAYQLTRRCGPDSVEGLASARKSISIRLRSTLPYSRSGRRSQKERY